MTSGFLSVLGGLGLFLLGMTVMTEGLRELAGDALRRALARFTKNPVTGAATGTVSTALIQSSSATTVMAVGFVGAGLLTFPQALGIIFGANIGTTITGWLVALLGFKLSLTDIVMPLIFVGALMRLFGKRKISVWGYALAGFGLVFAGIAMLQSGMEGFKDVVTPESFPPNTWLGRLLLVLIGVAITLVTQSSSAGVATAITAVHVGNITLAQAAALVIGMDVGTTVTAAMAAVGGNTDARRTGLAHVIYNLMTGSGAFVLLPIYIWGWDRFAPSAARSDPEIALVAFHTLFNAIGVFAALPFTNQFAALIVKLIPVRGSTLTRRLDVSFLKEPSVAIDNVHATLVDLAQVVFPSLADLLVKGPSTADISSRLEEAGCAVAESRSYLSQINTDVSDEPLNYRHLAALHVLDHMSRLIVRCCSEKPLQTARGIHSMKDIRDGLVQAGACDFGNDERIAETYEQLRQLWTAVDERIEPYRREVMQRTVTGDATIEEALSHLDASRWLRRVCYHVWRVVHHLSEQPPADQQDDLEPEPSNGFD
jgi:phosphate:Na+ symporter